MKRSPGRDIGRYLVVAAFLGLAGGFALGGVSGAIVAATLLIGAGAIATTADNADTGQMIPRRRPVRDSILTSFDGDPDEPIAAVEAAIAADHQVTGTARGVSRDIWRVFERWRLRTPAQAASLLLISVVAALTLVVYLSDIGTNPAGLFCDEAEIGLEAYRLLRGNAEVASLPFFYRHFGYDLGLLAPVATLPFVAVLGLDDLGVRVASAVPMLATLVGVFLTLRRLRIPYAIVAVSAYAFSPVVIHLSRVNFGHTPSLLLIAMGFDRYVVARQSGGRSVAAIAGILLGASAYGNASFYVATPLIIGAIGLSEVIYNRRDAGAYATYGLTAGFAAMWGIPLIVRALTDDQFWLRFREKNERNPPWFSTERFGELIDNYPKYFSKAYLFEVGEVGLPGAFIARHSVAGAGVLSVVALPLVLFGVVSWVVLRSDAGARFVLPWVVVAFLYPLPDLISTNDDQPPYTLSIFATSICLPYLAGWAMRGVQSIVQEPSRWRLTSVTSEGKPEDEPVAEGLLVPPTREDRAKGLAPVIAGLVLLWILVSGWRFYDGPYRRYPEISADYWGWQYGPQPMIKYFVEHADEYDEFIMDGNFNEAYIFLDFYIRDPDVRRRASIGDLSRLDPSKRQLFGIRAEVWDRIPGSQFPSKSYFVITEVIAYPNGDDAMYLVELR